jgi:hypothetical protein
MARRVAKKVKQRCPIHGCYSPVLKKFLPVEGGALEVIACSSRSCTWSGRTTGRVEGNPVDRLALAYAREANSK